MSGRLDGRKLLPYLTRAEIDVAARSPTAGSSWRGPTTWSRSSRCTSRARGCSVSPTARDGRPLRRHQRPAVQEPREAARGARLSRSRIACRCTTSGVRSQQLPEEQQLDLLAINPRYTFFKLTPAEGDPLGQPRRGAHARSLGRDRSARRADGIDRLPRDADVSALRGQPGHRRRDQGRARRPLPGRAARSPRRRAGRTKERGTLYILQPRNQQPRQQLALR